MHEVEKFFFGLVDGSRTYYYRQKGTSIYQPKTLKNPPNPFLVICPKLLKCYFYDCLFYFYNRFLLSQVAQIYIDNTKCIYI